MGEPLYRMASPADIPALVELFNMSNAGDTALEWGERAGAGESWRDVGMRDMARGDISISHRWAVVAELEGRVAGMLISNPHDPVLAAPLLESLPLRDRPFAWLMRLTGGCLFLRNMAVFPEFRGHRLATRLLDLAIFGGWQMGCKAVTAIVHESNGALLGHYAKRGMAVVETAPVQEHPVFAVGSAWHLLRAEAPGGFLPGSRFAQMAEQRAAV